MSQVYYCLGRTGEHGGWLDLGRLYRSHPERRDEAPWCPVCGTQIAVGLAITDIMGADAGLVPPKEAVFLAEKTDQGTEPLIPRYLLAKHDPLPSWWPEPHDPSWLTAWSEQGVARDWFSRLPLGLAEPPPAPPPLVFSVPKPAPPPQPPDPPPVPITPEQRHYLYATAKMSGLGRPEIEQWITYCAVQLAKGVMKCPIPSHQHTGSCPS